MLTGYNDSQIDADAMKHGALMCLHKPVGLKELADIIEKYA
jgi:FixJ family two-component response regulator